jgi:hypothetical protein
MPSIAGFLKSRLLLNLGTFAAKFFGHESAIIRTGNSP